MDYPLLIAEIEEDVRAGRLPAAVYKIKSLTLSKVPRAHRLPLANLCRRLRMLSHGLRLLGPLVNPEKNFRGDVAANPEKIEYALLLQRSGAVDECLRILDSCPQTQEALFTRASCHVGRWEYTEAVPLLKTYALTAETAYQSLIGQVNWAAGLVALGDLGPAAALLEECIARAAAGGYSRLQANALELRAQVSVARHHFDQAKKDLASAASILGAAGTHDNLFVSKWLAVIDCLQNGRKEPLLNFRGQALAQKSWESVREADLYLLKAGFDEKIFNHLVFGTPYPAYRERAFHLTGRKPSASEYIWGHESSGCLDITRGEFDGKPTALKPGGKSHQLLEILSRDFYSPQTTGTLFSQLFAGECFDIFSSPFRVRQTISRARKVLADDGIPLTIEEMQGQYALSIHGPVSVKVPYRHQKVEGYHAQLTKLQQALPGQDEFAPKAIRQVLEMPLTTYNRFINWAVEQGALEKTGSGPRTQYRRAA